jgi:uncharacterized SAM-binding protein YcdF (DUF218 family)
MVGSDVFIEDLNSTNGTYINGKAIKKQLLTHNDTVEIGKYKIKFLVDENTDYERTLTAARLFREGQVRLVIVTGGEPGPGDSAESLRAVAIRAGVPPERIRMEQVSRSTYGSMVAIRPILEREGVRSLTVVTSPYHQRRVLWCARRTLAGLDIVSRPSEPAGWKPEGWWKTRWNRGIVLGEYAKIAYYILRGWA